MTGRHVTTMIPLWAWDELDKAAGTTGRTKRDLVARILEAWAARRGRRGRPRPRTEERPTPRTLPLPLN
jgi:hypothetical protein